MKELPVFAVDLVKELDSAIPHKCPAKGASLEDIHRYAGQRDLVDSLVSRMKLTEEKGLS